jgi:hypothetical protein
MLLSRPHACVDEGRGVDESGVYQFVRPHHVGEVRGAALKHVRCRLSAAVLNADLRRREQPELRLAGGLDVDERDRDRFEGSRGDFGDTWAPQTVDPMTDRTVEVPADNEWSNLTGAIRSNRVSGKQMRRVGGFSGSDDRGIAPTETLGIDRLESIFTVRSGLLEHCSISWRRA